MSDVPDRRRHVRIAPNGSVVLRGRGTEQLGRIANLSEAAVFVRLPTTAWQRAGAVELELRLDAASGAWLHIPGQIVRGSRDGVAVTFDECPEELRSTIRGLVSISEARARAMALVLVDSHEGRRAATAAGFRNAGCTVVEAATPLEAIVRLGEAAFEPDVIAVAASQPSSTADELRRFLLRAHPDARVVVLADDVLEPDGIARWLSVDNHEADLGRGVRDALIARPPRR